MNIKPINPTTVQDQVYQELLGAIISGRIQPGQKITIEGVAKLMNVSLMPVRVALQKLEAGGFVTIGKNRRITANELTLAELDEILEIRLMIEGLAAERACGHRTEESIAALERMHDEFEGVDDEESYLLLNREFHALIYRQAGMPIMEEIIASLWNRVSPYLHIFAFADENWKIDKYDHHHQGMIQALKDRDPEAIRRWLTEDLTGAAAMTRAAMEKARSGKDKD